MKLKYHLRGLGIGFILTTIILMISNLFVNNNNGNNHVSDNKETSGSVIAYTTQADENNSDKKDEKKTEHAKTESAKDSTKESASQGTTQTETLYSKEGNTVTVKFENVIYGTAAAELLYKAGVIDDENSFAFYLQNMEPSPEQKNALERSGLGDLLKNAEPMKPIGIDSQYTVPIIHYEILFSLYSNTRLATADERKQKFLENQIVNLVEDCSADEIAPTYARLVSELQRGDYKLLDTWKKQQYQKAISILQE